MVSKEQLAHELTMLYLYNRYGNLLGGSFSNGHGSINTFRFPDASSSDHIAVEKKVKIGFLGLRTPGMMPSDVVAGEYFKEVVEEYRCAYKQILELLET